MSVNRSKSFTVGYVLLGLMFCLAAGIVMITRYQKMNSCYNDRPPLRSIDVTIDTSQSEQLIEQLKKFADKNGFKYEIAYYTPNREDFSVWMTRKDVEVVISSPFNPGEFGIDFYNNDCIQPTVASDIDGLLTDLKSFISEIPNVTITDVN